MERESEWMSVADLGIWREAVARRDLPLEVDREELQFVSTPLIHVAPPGFPK